MEEALSMIPAESGTEVRTPMDTANTAPKVTSTSTTMVETTDNTRRDTKITTNITEER